MTSLNKINLTQFGVTELSLEQQTSANGGSYVSYWIGFVVGATVGGSVRVCQELSELNKDMKDAGWKFPPR